MLYFFIVSFTFENVAENKDIDLVNPLSRLLNLDPEERESRGLLHTPSEIAQQPETWHKTLLLFRQRSADLQQFLRGAYEERRTIFLIGAGTSDYIGHAIAALLRHKWNTEVVVAASTDLLAGREDLLLPDRKYLWISFSRSGESIEGITVLEQALGSCPNILHLVVSCNAHSAMVRLAEQSENAYAVVLDDVVNDRGLAMTSSFTNMVVFGQAFATLWSGEDFEPTLAPMAQAAEFLLDSGAYLADELARDMTKSACFVGNGSLAAAARESALKVLELTSGAIQTISESTLALRHGPMSALNQQTVFTSFVSTHPKRCRYDLDLLNEIKYKQTVRSLVAVGHDAPAADHVLFCDQFGRIPDSHRPAVDVIFGQLFGLFASVECGGMPDSPSPNGIINRVVQRFKIYT